MSIVEVSRAGHFATVTLNRPDKMNAVTVEMLEGLVAASQHDDVRTARAVVLRGEGRAFCAGLDVMSFSGVTPDSLLERSHGTRNLFQAASLCWRDLEVPVIAALHDTCIGAGLQIALGADIRIAAPGTKLSIMEMKWGLVPDMGGMAVLPSLMPGDVMRRMIYTAEVITAEEAQPLGLVTEVADDPHVRALELAELIASKSPKAIRAAKRLSAIAETADEPTVLIAESEEQAGLIGGPEMMEQVAANMAKRLAVFK
ncbi:MAG: crotonase/enoyl-CoA hydratase family protein [Pseudomonadota bacterium]